MVAMIDLVNRNYTTIVDEASIYVSYPVVLLLFRKQIIKVRTYRCKIALTTFASLNEILRF